MGSDSPFWFFYSLRLGNTDTDTWHETYTSTSTSFHFYLSLLIEFQYNPTIMMKNLSSLAGSKLLYCNLQQSQIVPKLNFAPQAYFGLPIYFSLFIWVVILQWLIDHPEFFSNPFYIAGDSYSGITVPIIAHLISDGKKVFKYGNFRWLSVASHFKSSICRCRKWSRQQAIYKSQGLWLFSIWMPCLIGCYRHISITRTVYGISKENSF